MNWQQWGSKARLRSLKSATYDEEEPPPATDATVMGGGSAAHTDEDLAVMEEICGTPCAGECSPRRKSTQWQQWGAGLSAVMLKRLALKWGDNANATARSGLANQYSWDVQSLSTLATHPPSRISNALEAYGYSPPNLPDNHPAMTPAKHTTSAKWSHWGQRPCYLRPLPADIWQYIGVFLKPRDLYNPRLAIKLLADATHLLSYPCSNCCCSNQWTDVLVCQVCAVTSCKKCADPQDNPYAAGSSPTGRYPAGWAMHLCGSDFSRAPTCPKCSRYCATCSRPCCDLCGWKGGRGHGKRRLADGASLKRASRMVSLSPPRVRRNVELACLPCVVAACNLH